MDAYIRNFQYKGVAESYLRCTSKSESDVCPQQFSLDFAEASELKTSCNGKFYLPTHTRKTAKQQIQAWRKSCERLRKRSDDFSSRYLPQCCTDAQTVSVTVAQSAYANRTFCDICQSHRGICNSKLPNSHSCNSLSSVLTPKRVAQLCCTAKLLESSDGTAKVDTIIAQSSCENSRSEVFENQSELLRLRHDQNLCERYKLAKNQGYDLRWAIAECERLEWTDSTTRLLENFEGFSCDLNRTLQFVAIDTMRFPHMAEKIGISPINEAAIVNRNWTTVVILDRKVTRAYNALNLACAYG